MYQILILKTKTRRNKPDKITLEVPDFGVVSTKQPTYEDCINVIKNRARRLEGRKIIIVPVVNIDYDGNVIETIKND